MFDGFELIKIETPDVGFGPASINLRHGGTGYPLLLLHGNPLTHYSWHKNVPLLNDKYHLVCADLRGYGDSVGPDDGGEESINYSFRAIAADLVHVMSELGYEKFFVAGHDRGARTAHRMALDYPEQVAAACFIDILPSHHIWTDKSVDVAGFSWHWLFMKIPYDFPERMMAGVSAEYYIKNKISKPKIGLKPFSEEALAEYIRCFNWKTIRGSCEDYRACATSDLTMDSEDFASGRKVSCPLYILWGAHSHTGQRYGDVLEVWRDYASGPIDGTALDAGHYPNEELPEKTSALLDQHFQQCVTLLKLPP